jgi:FMN-dependent NADH-azoreductase
MAKVLHIQASPRGERSYSRRAAEAFLKGYLSAHPGDTVETLDLAGDIPEFGGAAISGKYRILHGEALAKEETDAWKVVLDEIERFKGADKIVISAPMWNFGIPYRLKQYFDVIVQPGSTFSYSPDTGYSGLVTGKPALLVLARGGEYAPDTPSAAYDQQKPYLEGILGFIGFTNVGSIMIEPTMMGGPEVAQRKLDEAIVEARERAKNF